jgi:hypothetical protein
MSIVEYSDVTPMKASDESLDVTPMKAFGTSLFRGLVWPIFPL